MTQQERTPSAGKLPDHAREQGMHHLLLASAERAPDAPAYGPVSYGSLAARAARVAGALRATGMEPGARVTIALDACVEYLVAYYGVLMAGATVVPLSPETRAKGLARALAHSGSAALIAGRAVLGRLDDMDPLPEQLRVTLRVGAGEATPGDLGAPGGAAATGPASSSIDFAEVERDGPELFDVGTSASDLACVTYTSGTTGEPKGVMLSHGNLVANVRSIVSYLELGPADRLAMVLPYYYVYGNSVLHTHLAVGGSIVHAGSPAFPVRVLQTMQDERCTGLSGVPATFASLLRVDDLDRFGLDDLRYLTQAGGPMTPRLTERVRAAFPRARLYVMYGQTEASARLSYLPPEALDRKPGSVGIAIPDVTLSVVDSAGRRVPPGTTGEIVASGPNVMLGYLGDPAETERVLRDGVLHTGDMGYFDEDGYLFISGRDSEMISSGGHRIGPQEIESVLSAQPDVEECAVVGVDDERLGQRVVAVVVPRDGAPRDARALQRACLAELPRYKVPSEVRFVTELPRSDRGKVLRRAVRAELERPPVRA